jgi:hypothetical protein
MQKGAKEELAEISVLVKKIIVRELICYYSRAT